MKPCILMNPYPFVSRIRREDLLKFILSLGTVKCYLIVSGSHITLVGVYPDLQKFDVLIRIFIIFTMHDACSCAHNLNVSFLDDGLISHAVFMYKGAFQWNTDNFHVIMGMQAKSASSSDDIIIQDA